MPNIALIKLPTESGVMIPMSNQFQIAQKPANANIPEKSNWDSMPRKYDSFCDAFSLSSSGNKGLRGAFGFCIQRVWWILVQWYFEAGGAKVSQTTHILLFCAFV